MVQKFVTWEDIANDVLKTQWRTGDFATPGDAIRGSDLAVVKIALLRDIAISLRVLRCDNFQRIPSTLHEIDYALAALLRIERKRDRKKKVRR